MSAPGFKCRDCAGDPRIAEIAKSFGHRVDLAAARIRDSQAEIERLTALVVLLRDAGMHVLIGAAPAGGFFCKVGDQRLRKLGEAVRAATTPPTESEVKCSSLSSTSKQPD